MINGLKYFKKRS